MARHKFETGKVNLSTSFAIRSRCKFCGKHPSIYYCARNPVLWNSPRKILEQFVFYSKYLKRVCSEFYLDADPADFNNINYFSCQLPFKNFNPKLHRARGVHPIFNYIEFISCECGGSVWAYANKSSKSRLEIAMRKARDSFPQNFNFKRFL